MYLHLENQNLIPQGEWAVANTETWEEHQGKCVWIPNSIPYIITWLFYARHSNQKKKKNGNR